VSGKFDDGDIWRGWTNGPGEWCVAYHGTRGCYVKSITEQPLRPGSRGVHGYGIYCNPDVHESECYADETEIPTPNGTIKCKYVFMCRVNTRCIHHCTMAPCPEAHNPQYTLHMTTIRNTWFVNCQNACYQNIRTYGLLVKEV
jgi:hypothetical protein